MLSTLGSRGFSAGWGVRIVVHVDLNAFFASVEQAADPRLRGRPVAVTGGGARTVVLTASYEARAYGVKTGMQVPEAQGLCPGLVLVAADNAKYTDICSRLVGMYEEYADAVEVFSIDEVFLDATETAKFWPSPRDMALEIKRRIREGFRLTCSIGIAPNKLLAKLASDLMKPDGLVEVSGDRPEQFLLEGLPVDELCGIGPRLAAHLSRMGIRTLGDLGRCPVETLWDRFGKTGLLLHRMALGLDESPVVDHRAAEEAKSVGHSMTIDHDVSDPEEMRRILLQLSERVGRRMRREGVRGRTVHVTVRHFDFQTFGRQRTYDSFVDEGLDLHLRACEVLATLPTHVPVRLLGVSVSGLTRAEQLPVFEGDRRRRAAVRAMDAINDRWGENTVFPGELAERAHPPGVISPAWRPAGMRKVDFSHRSE